MDIRDVSRHERRIEVLEAFIKPLHPDVYLDVEFGKCEKYGGHKWSDCDAIIETDEIALRAITRRTCVCCSFVLDVAH